MSQLAIPLEPGSNLPGEATTDGGATRVAMPTDSTNVNGKPPETPKTERPAYLPEGIDTPEALAEAYKALMAKPADTPAKTEAPAKDGKLAITTPEQAEALAKSKGIDLAALSAEFAEHGELSPESLKELTDKGIPETAVSAYIEGQKAQAALFMQDIAAHVGGEDTLQSILSWATTGIPAADITLYNTLLQSSDKQTVKVALDALKGKMEAAVGVEGVRVTGKGVPATQGVKPFASMAEVTAAMRDPRYAKDKAYRKQITDRLAVSDI